MKRSRKEANIFLVVGGTPVLNQMAQISTPDGAEKFVWTEEVNKAFEKGELDARYKDAQLITPVIGLRYTILNEGDVVFNAADNTKGVFKSLPAKDLAIVSFDGTDKEVSRKDVYKILSESLSASQMSPVILGRLRHFNKIILDFPIFEFESIEGGVNVIVDGEIKEFIKSTGDEAADNYAKAMACNKYALPGRNEDGSLRMTRYIRKKN